MGTAEQRLKELGINLPRKDIKRTGVIPIRREGDLLLLTVEQGYEAAQSSGINLLAALKNYLGTLDRVVEIVKVLGFVASAPDFYDQPSVMHGFSDLMVEIFGERGKHARSAIGTNVLPHNQPVEIEIIVRIREQ
jgi:enamine deaminase RidA (YjgF/YER057c/UK114 family)